MIEALSNSTLMGNSPSLTAKEAAENNSQLKMEDFLQLLTSQITNQDPLEPMKDTEFISQMANIASLEQMQQFTQGFSKFANSHGEMLAQSYLGNHVSITSNNREISGVVEAVDKLDDGSIQIVVDGQSYDPADVRRVELLKSNQK
ncbi:MAG: flagellar hook capping FlgD N-terminal domain-containing protein [Opitutae bacterium]